MRRMCLINDCTGFVGVAPCCLDCADRQRCPDKCPRTETTFCVGVLENDCKGISEKSDQDPERD
jgi:hypothetical protein